MELTRDDLRNYMNRCIELALQHPPGVGRPFVGALILTENFDIAGEGYRSLLPGTNLLYHAERMALDKAGERTRGATLFTTLEPCVNIKAKQLFKSCSELIAEGGIKTVIVGAIDSSLSQNNGCGIDYLKKHDIVTIVYKGLRDIIGKELLALGRISSAGV